MHQTTHLPHQIYINTRVLHLPDLTRPYIHPAAGVVLRGAHAYLSAPAVALSCVSRAAAADQQATVATPIPLRDGPFQNRALPSAIGGRASLEQVRAIGLCLVHVICRMQFVSMFLASELSSAHFSNGEDLG